MRIQLFPRRPDTQEPAKPADSPLPVKGRVMGTRSADAFLIQRLFMSTCNGLALLLLLLLGMNEYF